MTTEGGALAGLIPARQRREGARDAVARGPAGKVTRACARGHAGKVTRGQGAHGTLEARWRALIPCKGANRSRAPVQRCKGERLRSVSGSRVSAVGSQARVIRFGYGCGIPPEPVPGAELLNLGPDGRDLGPENESRQLGQNAVLPLPRYSGCDVIASLPCFVASNLWRPNRQPLSANRQHLCNPTVSLY